VKRLLLFAVILAGACGRDPPKPVAPTATDGEIAATDAESDAAVIAPPPRFADQMRRDQYEDAAKTIDALPEADRQNPETRYARARIALFVSDGARVLKELEGLEQKLPALDAAIAETRARAQLLVGPYDTAAAFFVKRSGTPEDQLVAANAFVKAKDEAGAMKACGVVLGTEHRSRRQEAEARSIRMKLSTATDAQIGQDARWLAVKAPDLAFSDGADAAITKHDPTHPLSGKELAERARVLADATRIDDALDALSKAATSKNGPLTAIDVKRAQADARMRARVQYKDAAKLWLDCANTSGGTVDDLLSSARALSRADDDDDAIKRYGDVAKKFPKTGQAADATFLAARLQILHGRWKLAAESLDDYLKRFPAGGDRDSATKLRAIARLANGENGVAKKLLETIAASERDSGTKARFQNLAALAAYRDGDKTHATATWTEVARSQPLTWAALVARSRLTEAGAPLPPTIDPAKTETVTPLAVALPPPVDLLDRIGLDGDAERELRSREGALSGAAPQRQVEATCIGYGMIGRGERRLQVAQQIANATVQTAPSTATRWAWECLFPEPFAAIVDEVELKETLPRGLVHAVMRQESGFDADVTSPARAIGLLQLLPETAKAVAKELAIPHEEAWLIRPAHNITLGGHYLHGLLVKFSGALPLAIASYNAGPEAVGRWKDRMKGLDLDALVEAIPYTETKGYVVRVMGNLARYAYLHGGDTGVPDVKLTL
jgi:soluble lytic murein transglycosylase